MIKSIIDIYDEFVSKILNVNAYGHRQPTQDLRNKIKLRHNVNIISVYKLSKDNYNWLNRNILFIIYEGDNKNKLYNNYLYSLENTTEYILLSNDFNNVKYTINLINYFMEIILNKMDNNIDTHFYKYMKLVFEIHFALNIFNTPNDAKQILIDHNNYKSLYEKIDFYKLSNLTIDQIIESDVLYNYIKVEDLYF